VRDIEDTTSIVLQQMGGLFLITWTCMGITLLAAAVARCLFRRNGQETEVVSVGAGRQAGAGLPGDDMSMPHTEHEMLRELLKIARKDQLQQRAAAQHHSEIMLRATFAATDLHIRTRHSERCACTAFTKER
jgi:hypothetical protein